MSSSLKPAGNVSVLTITAALGTAVTARLTREPNCFTAFLTAVPWIDVVLICAFFFWVGGRITVKPGVVFDLPSGPFEEGLHDTVTAVLLPAKDMAQAETTLVFFDDERYSLGDAQQREQLGRAMRAMVSHTWQRELLLLADKRVLHGDVMATVQLARAAGLQRINVGMKPD